MFYQIKSFAFKINNVGSIFYNSLIQNSGHYPKLYTPKGIKNEFAISQFLFQLLLIIIKSCSMKRLLIKSNKMIFYY